MTKNIHRILFSTAPTLTNPNWSPVGTSTADGNGRFTFFPAKALSSGALFFRAVETIQ